MTLSNDLADLDAVASASAFRAGAASAVEITRAALTRIARHDPAVGAFLRVDAEGAIATAQRLDARRAAGEDLTALPLAGTVVAVKDVLSTRGLRTTCASKMLERYVPPYDASCVARLRAAGAVLIGKTNMDEFAMGSSTENSAYHPTRNPWDLSRTPGGSSGGSAAAVSARLSHTALGTDTGGSVRQPAALTGTVGLKPTWGRVSRYGLVAFASSLDVVSPFARSVADVSALYDAVAGPDARDATCSDRPAPRADLSRGESILKGLRVGVPAEYFAEGIDADVAATVRAAIAKMAAAGAEIVELSMPHTRYAVATYYVLAPAEASSNLARFDGVRYGLRVEAKDLRGMYGATRDRGFGPEVKRRILLGTFALSAGYYDAFYGKAQRARAMIAKDFSDAFECVDVIAAPTSPTAAFKLGERVDDPLAMYLADVCTLPASLAGVPAISLPAGLGASGLPVGLQLMAPAFEEPRLLAVAHGVEGLLGRLPPPPLT
ncbi:MAG: Asp-tRNA(Asn)/Glu-tRNA(Gln) amidotransferase subunit GatA [Polyangiales bacterium]